MIRKLIAPLALVLMLSSACKKENETIPSEMGAATESVQPEGSIGSKIAPVTFTQKLLIEMFGTVHCGTCPDMEQKCRTQIKNHPNRVYGYVAHNSDAMDFGMFDYLDSVYNVPTYASGMLNRTPYNGTLVMAKQYWNTYVNTALSTLANCGLQIATSVSGSTATITVDAGFNAALTGNYKLTVLLYQDSVKGIGSNYDQANYYNNIAGSLWYGLGNPMIGYQHDYVSRKVLSSTKMGDPIPASAIVPYGVYTKTYTVNISGYNANKLNVLAFINKVGTTSTTHRVMNVQGTKLGTTKLFD